MRTTTKPTTRLRQLIEAPEILVMPGVHDALAARIAEQAGFKALTAGGYASSAALLGRPDTSQLTMTEMAAHYGRLTQAIDIPLFGDGDTGFGNPTNTARTVRAYEQAGLAGMFIEDQVFPKRCGHMAGKAVVDLQTMLAKLAAALEARRDPDFVIMARTDALAVEGLDAAIARGRAFAALGADAVFVEAPRDEAQMARITAEIPVPLMANQVEGGLTPILPPARLQDLGYAFVAYPVAATYAAAHAFRQLYGSLAEHGTAAAMADRMLDFSAFNSLIGLPELRDWEESMLTKARVAGGGD
ncbi:isocitrate lyase/PEP mutase family protein [Roseospirillum parvum]|uniref:Methylisocitrate lyase n=1 Tax=Roseospirillum parvum TaxID=83401 RepID=A0A1G8ETW7_9PROT|nr:oxaloacetate decarboxylase [Roseospirillum parvum]SDH73351.1 methylisocitrate lyase [Roseospirillum parvum]